MPLSDAKVRNAKSQDKPYKIADSEGLYLYVTPAAGKIWRFKYRFAGKEKLLVFGTYPAVSLSDARDKRAAAKKSLAAGIDPSEAQRAAKRLSPHYTENNFEAVAREWLGNRKSKWNEDTADLHERRLEMHVFPRFKDKQISKIKPIEMLELLREIEARGTTETVRRVMQDCSKVFNYAIASQKAEYNPVTGLGEALKPHVSKNRAFLKPDDLPEFYLKLEAAPLKPLTRLGLKLVIMLMLRTIELRGGEWPEINFKTATWQIPAERMKMKTPHIVPLPHQAVNLLKEIQKISGEGKFIFPNEINDAKFMSENTLLFAMYGMGYRSRATVHGFRSTASTVLNENGFPSDWIERQLAHEERNSVRAAYNHAQYLPQRRKMLKWWAAYLDKAARTKPARKK